MPAPSLVSLPTAPAAPSRRRSGPVRAYLRGRLLRWAMGIDPAEATFARRGFTAGDEAVRHRLEGVGFTFLDGYHAALEAGGQAGLAARLDAVQPAMRGFAYEGAAMALALRDALFPWRGGRLAAFLGGAGDAHAYMVHVGAGWALARLRRRFTRIPRGMDPLLGWLAADGYGFHEGYFHPRSHVDGQAAPRRLHGYARCAFDQGLGRSLWFVHGADPVRIGAAIARFSAERHEALWSGAGLACAYAGGGDEEGARALARAAGGHRPAVAQGAAFAAEARRRAGNLAAHTDRACRILCGVPAARAAELTLAAREGVKDRGRVPAYQEWRARLQHHFANGSRA